MQHPPPPPLPIPFAPPLYMSRCLGVFVDVQIGRERKKKPAFVLVLGLSVRTAEACGGAEGGREPAANVSQERQTF